MEEPRTMCVQTEGTCKQCMIDLSYILIYQNSFLLIKITTVS